MKVVRNLSSNHAATSSREGQRKKKKEKAYENDRIKFKTRYETAEQNTEEDA